MAARERADEMRDADPASHAHPKRIAAGNSDRRKRL